MLIFNLQIDHIIQESWLPKIYLSFLPAIPLEEFVLQIFLKNLQRFSHKDVHHCTVYNSIIWSEEKP